MNHISTTLLFLLISLNCFAQNIEYGGKNFFLNGANICWKNYGWDFGDNALGYGGGNGYDAEWWENTFTAIESYKGNSVRIWVHCKGEHNPLFDAHGNCTGLNTNFFNNLDDLLSKAENHNLMVILCLFDFHLVDVGRQSMIKDVSKTTSYINNALIPMVQRYESQCNLLAWEIINEPEWIMQNIPGGGNYGNGNIQISEMQRFVGLCAAAIHNNSSKKVTLGSASLKWNSEITPAAGNYWSNSKLYAATGNNNKAYLDFYQIHYYDWMAASFSPYNTLKQNWGLDKPTIVGETGNEGHYTYQQQFDFSHSNGFAGCMPWAFESGGAASWSDFNNEMLTFRNAHPSIVGFDCSVLSYKPSIEHLKVTIPNFLNKHTDITLENASSISTITILDIQGHMHYQSSIPNNSNTFTILNKFKEGMYIIQLETKNGPEIHKLVIQ